jgi:hypothetical protein
MISPIPFVTKPTYVFNSQYWWMKNVKLLIKWLGFCIKFPGQELLEPFGAIIKKIQRDLFPNAAMAGLTWRSRILPNHRPSGWVVFVGHNLGTAYRRCDKWTSGGSKVSSRFSSLDKETLYMDLLF